jgi:hypothetical protein
MTLTVEIHDEACLGIIPLIEREVAEAIAESRPPLDHTRRLFGAGFAFDLYEVEINVRLKERKR